MKDPMRLVHQGATAAELALLRAGVSEEPSEEGMQRLSAALGLGAGAIASTLATKSTAPPAVGAASKIAAKWIVAGAIGVVGSAALVFTQSLGKRPAPAEAPPAIVRHGALSPPESLPAPIPGPVTPSEAAPTPASPEANSASATRSHHAATPSIAREIADLDGARRSLGAGDPRGALRALDAYDEDARSGMLRQEASLLRIEALAKAGDVASARRLGRAFLRAHPESPHEARVRALIGESP